MHHHHHQPAHTKNTITFMLKFSGGLNRPVKRSQDKLRGLCIRLSGRHSTKTTRARSLEIPDPRKSFSPPQRNSTPSRWSGGISVIVSFCIVDQKIQSLTRVSDRDVARHTKNGCGRARHLRHPIICMLRRSRMNFTGRAMPRDI